MTQSLGRPAARQEGAVLGEPRPSWGQSLRSLVSVHSVAGQVFLLQLTLTVLLVVAAGTALVLQARDFTMEEATQRTVSTAEAFAHSPGTLSAMKSADPGARLQPTAEAARKATGVDYVVAFNPAGIRWTHPDPSLIGKRVIGSFEPALAGHTMTATFRTSVGLAVNATVPVIDTDGSVVGLVSVGITVENVNAGVSDRLPLLLGSAVGALLVVTAGSVLVSRRLRRQTHGLDPTELSRMYEHHDAVLHAVKEGVLITSGDGRLLLANDEAKRLLDLPPGAEGRSIADLGLAPPLAELLVAERVVTDEVHRAGDRLLAVNVRSTALYGGPAGNAVTLRDSTELRALAGRAQSARERLQLLYDAGVRIGTTLDVVHTAEELADVAVPRFADAVTVELLDSVIRGGEPSGDTTEMRRTAVTGMTRKDVFYPVGELIRFAPATPMAQSMGNGHAVLEADLSETGGWRTQNPERARRILDHGIRSLISVPLRARGVVLGLADFWRLESTGPFESEDLSTAEELAARAAVAIDNARRFTREHAMAVTLQRSLLPGALPEQSALQVAHRYLPAEAGVGGDWFDLIPLPGARVALVVGDVVGHGVRAAATMGQLRTAVHNFSSLDLTPDELLIHLDEQVARIDAEAVRDGDGDGVGVVGATCLYAIYDAVTGHVTMASSGHPGPAVVRPDGTVTFLDVPVSPPLGLGGSMPMETLELFLPEGSRLVLYTDGLIEGRHRDFDTGIELLRAALTTAGADRTPQETCTDVLDAVLPERPDDDIALMVARTRLLDPGRVAEWAVPSDPEAVATVRSACLRQLDAWGLDGIAFTAELVLSELITNAIRYGTEPIKVRMLYDRNLICEISDGSSTAPHLRRAATTDEGGRGLFLVAHYTERWGTRYPPRGKVIWAELSPHAGEQEPVPDLGDDFLEQWVEPDT
ncbi:MULTISPECIES: SpoIIE family protein phosphatase [unclassified Streptomyces]|uniref:SpoIIE family protein phosphatase n=1 Tax=unclassified Streptomyces TaxID=2593676 RepID=UPI0036E73FA5